MEGQEERLEEETDTPDGGEAVATTEWKEQEGQDQQEEEQVVEKTGGQEQEQKTEGGRQQEEQELRLDRDEDDDEHREALREMRRELEQLEAEEPAEGEREETGEAAAEPAPAENGDSSGNEGELPTWSGFKARVRATLEGATAASFGALHQHQRQRVATTSTAASEGGDGAVLAEVPAWPHEIPVDLATAFVIEEILAGGGKADESWQLAAAGAPNLERMHQLVQKMTTADKRRWLNQRLYRIQAERPRAGADQARDAADSQGSSPQPTQPEEDEPLAFIECDREGCPLSEMRLQHESGTGLMDDISGVVEVRFKGESSVGSAVLREWMAHAVDHGFCKPSNNLLASNDGGRSFCFSPSASETHPTTALLDAEVMGRFVGAALLRRVCVGLRFHVHVCKLILLDGKAWAAPTDEEICAFDELFFRNHVQYLRSAGAEELEMLELSFTDTLDPFADSTTNTNSAIDEDEESKLEAGKETGQRVPTAVAQRSVELCPGPWPLGRWSCCSHSSSS